MVGKRIRVNRVKDDLRDHWHDSSSELTRTSASRNGRVSESRLASSAFEYRRFSSTIRKLRMAPMIATKLFTHQGRPNTPTERPKDWTKPESVGPNALHKLADDAATPLRVPRTFFDGAALASMMARDG